MKDDIAQLFLKYGMQPPKTWTSRKPYYVPKWDCFAIRRMTDGIYVCKCLDRLYCKYEICNFFKTRETYYAERIEDEEY